MPLTSDNSNLSDPMSGPKYRPQSHKIAGICNFSLNAKQRKTAEICEKGDFEDQIQGQNIQNSVDFYLAQSQAENTRKAYRSDLEQFEVWGGTVPASPEQVATYLAESASYLAVSTLKRRVAALAWAHKDKGVADPTKSELVKRVLKGIERHHGVTQKQAAPLLLEQLERIVAGLGPSRKDHRDKALLLVGFYGAFRGSELLSLRVEDCAFERDEALLFLRKSKTDQNARGRWIAVPGHSYSGCPVGALKSWVRECGYDRGPLFRPLKGSPGALERELSVRSLSRLIRQHVLKAGTNPEGYSSHSLRAGFVTSALAHGDDPASVSKQTGHKSTEMLTRYDRPLLGRLSTAPERFGAITSSQRVHQQEEQTHGTY